MTREHLHDLIARGEGPALELKRSLTKDLGRELCAFANCDGGPSSSASPTAAGSLESPTTTA